MIGAIGCEIPSLLYWSITFPTSPFVEEDTDTVMTHH